MTDTELAWCAGIIDGEGTITLKDNGNDHVMPAILFTMTHESTVRRFHKIMKVGTVSKLNFPQSPNHKYKYTWNATSANAVVVIKLLQPYLFTKLSQAILALEFSERCWKQQLTDQQRILRRVLVDEMRDLNKKGP